MNTWTASPEHPGYRVKTLQRDTYTVQILRPVLTEEERAEREGHARTAIGGALKNYIFKKEKNT